MLITIQDPRHARNYRFTDSELQEYLLDDPAKPTTADYVFVLPSGDFLESVPTVTPSTDGSSRLLIRDPATSRAWVLTHADLEGFAVGDISDDDGSAWFSIPDDEVVLEAIPFFRRGLVQNSS